MIDIAAIKARADKATAGPWANDAPACVAKLWPEGGKMTVATAPHETFFGIANAEFIAHARTDIPALLTALEASEAARLKAEQERDAVKERAAKIAEKHASLYTIWELKSVAELIAAAIRAGE